MIKISLSLTQLECLLNEQKEIVIEKLLGNSGHYNLESDEGHYNSLPIDKEKFKTSGTESKYPYDVIVLLKYLGGKD